ncbi:TIGR01620 family protein [Pseudooceanicola sp.]|uniref:YcjF family protein n=1 Tax=Pseudooceanicola sp. TaxID=1914328 RepID=UPI00261F280E|nr:TIGR01620 family protein [Pseudooceanicola sp.]MDF1854353.1 TIGR01620 family protein [Pseudooceanicola sp.]
MPDTPPKSPPSKAPVLIDLDDSAEPASPAEAPPVPDLAPDIGPETGRAMQIVATLGARHPSRLARWFWGLALALFGAFLSLAAWNAVTGLIAATPLLGYAVTALIAAFALVCLAIVVKEIVAFSRLSRMDRLQSDAKQVLLDRDLVGARALTTQLTALYGRRGELAWGLQRFHDRAEEQFDAEALIALAETEILTPLDAAALREAEAAARQVATVTALVPLAFADVIVALTTNLRMIRRIAEIYGGRSGTLGSWRLTRAVMTHLVATGVVAVGDDTIGSILGGTMLARLSRRFGEGLVNGALTARVGIAAMEVCRPLPFGAGRRPSVTGTIRRALTGLFGSKEKPPAT